MSGLPVLIGIAGGTASGKTSIAQELRKEFSDHSVVIIREDDYYNKQVGLTYEERCKTNYDHPLAFDYELLYAQLNDLIAGKSIEKPTYDYTIHNRSDITETVHPADVIIIEGLFPLQNQQLRERLDIKIFVDTPADVRFIRRLKRDTQERARTMESVINQYLTTVKPMHDQFVEPSKQYAHVIIPEGVTNLVAIDLLKTKINSVIQSKMI